MFTTKGFYFIFQDAPLLLLTLSIIPFSDKLFNTFKTVCSEQDNNSESCFLVTVESFLIASRIISSLPTITYWAFVLFVGSTMIMAIIASNLFSSYLFF